MKKIHINVPDELHDKIMSEAKSMNTTIQKYVQDALMNNKSNLLIQNQEQNKDYLFTFIDLFAGIGGTRLAFQNNGGKCVFSSEWDKYCQITYKKNFGDEPHGDITQIPNEQIPDFDVLVAGFPCQPFSIAGVSKKNSLGRPTGFLDKTQGTLFFQVARIIEGKVLENGVEKFKRPKAFLLENVKNLRTHDKGKTFEVISKTLEELNYAVFPQVIDAIDYVPQHRERIFIVGFDKDYYGDDIKFSFPEQPKGPRPVLNDILAKEVDPKYTLTDHLWEYLQQYAKRHKEKGNGFGYGLADLYGQTRTLSARYHKDGSEILIPQEGKNPRRLTPQECARLMGFPNDFVIPVSDTQAYRQFGNSVVVPVVQAIAAKIVAKMQEYKNDHGDENVRCVL